MGLLGSAGAKKAAEEQAKIAKRVAGDWQKLGQTEYSWFQPFMQSGTEALSGQMALLANPMNSQEELASYYSGPEYALQEQQAQYQAQSTAANPYSSMGGSATGNYLGTQSTTLGQNYLKSQAQGRQQEFTNLGGISKMGLSASGTMGSLGTKAMQGIASAMGTYADAEAQAEMAGPRALTSALTGGLSAAIKSFGKSAGKLSDGGKVSTGEWLTDAGETIMGFL
jgi:hypothetical protein